MADLSPKAAALRILNKGGANSTAEEILELSRKLKDLKSFNYARRILGIGITLDHVSNDVMLKMYQQLALCTGKDADLSAAVRFDAAIDILNDNIPSLASTTNQETLGIAGGIMKKKWENDGQLSNLEASFSYYYKGYKLGISNNQGYCAINAAFVLDLLVINTESSGQGPIILASQNGKTLKEEADTIRKEIIEQLKAVIDQTEDKYKWWILVTIAEAHFGLAEYEEAQPYLQQAMKLPDIAEWEKETTTRQLARIAQIHGYKDDLYQNKCWDVLKELINNKEEDIAALTSAFTGKVGLALSGGGFRASLYHIGVLARLAEIGMLRNIEVLSCVSGGSIIGAHYYLELRNLLETKTDNEISDQDYINIVNRISTDFLSGVQRNLRTRVIANPFRNIKMLFSSVYSRTNRIGELYEEELFSKVKDGNGNNERWLNHLYVHPLQNDGQKNTGFNPKYDNWKRKAKVPILILNATTLNTGHNWQFTASWMGESPAAIQKIDGNYRLRRMYYKEDSEEKFQRKIRLGYAVAASSGVPGMFEPITLPELYEGKVVRLVDGGVHDNQGICGLLEQDCEVMLISDASGQMGSIDKPAGDALGVPLRANDILMERVRNAQYQDMNRRFTAGLLKGFMFIHLKLYLDVASVDWVECEDPVEKDPGTHPDAKILPYDIRKDMQTKLAAIRTDLDSFNDTEAYALMMSGYQMTLSEFSKGVSIPVKETRYDKWNFLDMQQDLVNFDTPVRVGEILDAGKEQAFKIWHLSKVLKITSKILLACFAAGAIYLGWKYRDYSLLSVKTVGITVIFFVAGMFLSKWIIKVIRYRETLIRFVTAFGLAFVGFFLAWIHIGIFDKWFLRVGKRKKQN